MSLTTGWSNSQITANTLRVLRHLADYMTSHPGQAPGAADLAADLGIEVHQVSHAFDSLRERGLVQLAESLAPEATAAFLQPSGVEASEAGRARRESTNTRRAACRAALLDWMDRDDDSFGPYVMEFLHDPRAWYYGEKFTEADMRRSAATLRDNGLMQSVDSAQEDFLRTKITEAGRDCLGRFNGDIGAWSDRQRGVMAAQSTNINVHGSQGVTIASQSPGARQSITVTNEVPAQVVNLADAYEQALPLLGLTQDDHSLAEQQIAELRVLADQDAASHSRLRTVLENVRQVAVSGTGAALGTGIVALVDSLVLALPM